MKTPEEIGKEVLEAWSIQCRKSYTSDKLIELIATAISAERAKLPSRKSAEDYVRSTLAETKTLNHRTFLGFMSCYDWICDGGKRARQTLELVGDE